MKALFILLSIVCAVALSTLSVIFATGRIPFREAAPLSEATEAATPTNETLSIFPSEANMVDELEEALRRRVWRRHAERRKSTVEVGVSVDPSLGDVRLLAGQVPHTGFLGAPGPVLPDQRPPSLS